MCVLIVCPPGATPSRTDLVACERANSDGAGFAVPHTRRVHVERDVDGVALLDRFLAYRRRFPDTWAVLHFRWATHGSVRPENCHPFPVGGDPRTVLFHNGILPVDVPKGDDRSDTRVFADEWAEYIGPDWLDDPAGFEGLEEWAGTNKLAVVTVDARYQFPVYIVNEPLGEWIDGVWFSNTNWQWSTRWSLASLSTAASRPSSRPSSRDDFVICESCARMIDVDDALDGLGACPACGACVWCGEWPERHCSGCPVEDWFADDVDDVDDDPPVVACDDCPGACVGVCAAERWRVPGARHGWGWSFDDDDVPGSGTAPGGRLSTFDW